MFVSRPPLCQILLNAGLARPHCILGGKRDRKIVPLICWCKVVGANVIDADRIVFDNAILIAVAACGFHSDCFCKQSVYAVDHFGYFFSYCLKLHASAERDYNH